MRNMHSRWRLLIVFAVVFALAAACGDDDDGPTASDGFSQSAGEAEEPAIEVEESVAGEEEIADPEPAEETEEAPAADEPRALADLTWEELIAQAQEEGEVAWFQWFLQPRFREVVEAFEEEYGIEVVVPDGTFDANHDKFLAELGRETGDIDILSTWPPFIEESEVQEVFTPLLSPDLDILITEFNNIDSEGHGAAFWGNQTGLGYNPDLVSEDELPQTIEQMEAWMQANPKQFGISDPAGGGSGPSFILAVIRTLAGDSDAYFDAEFDAAAVESWGVAWEWFNNNRDLFVVTASNADSVTRLNDGEFVIVPTYEDLLFGLQVDGAISRDLKFYVPEWGSPGGRNFVVIPQNAPHPAAAQLFVHWLTSAETQTTLNNVFGSSPTHPEADDSNSLIPAEQRALQTFWPADAYYDYLSEQFVEQVLN